jgi:hypothetical protein
VIKYLTLRKFKIIMKRNLIIIGLLLVILIACNACHSRWHDRREMRDSGKLIRMRMGMNFRHHMGMPGMRGAMGQGMRNGMIGGFGSMPMDSAGWMPMGEGRWIMESIPNVTENQKKEIADLIKKHAEEMKTLREEMSSKMQSLMDSHKKDIFSIRTEEQKKFIESGRGKYLPDPDVIKR